MRSLLFILLLLPFFAFAQSGNDIVLNDNGNANTVIPDTPPQPVQQGVIKVRKPKKQPFFKCEYYMTLSKVRMGQVPVETPFGIQMDEQPFFDSSYYSSNAERVYPVKEIHFSRQLVDTVGFYYSFDDTASIDTMVVQMWIGTNGKVKWVDADTNYTGEMPAALRGELYRYANSITDWGKGGGYKTAKQFLRKQKKIAESYYCKMYIIVSSTPLTAQQKHTGASYAPFDIPLNSPPQDDQQKEFLDDNKIPGNNDRSRK